MVWVQAWGKLYSRQSMLAWMQTGNLYLYVYVYKLYVRLCKCLLIHISVFYVCKKLTMNCYVKFSSIIWEQGLYCCYTQFVLVYIFLYYMNSKKWEMLRFTFIRISGALIPQTFEYFFLPWYLFFSPGTQVKGKRKGKIPPKTKNPGPAPNEKSFIKLLCQAWLQENVKTNHWN